MKRVSVTKIITVAGITSVPSLTALAPFPYNLIAVFWSFILAVVFWVALEHYDPPPVWDEE